MKGVVRNTEICVEMIYIICSYLPYNLHIFLGLYNIFLGLYYVDKFIKVS